MKGELGFLLDQATDKVTKGEPLGLFSLDERHEEITNKSIIYSSERGSFSETISNFLLGKTP